jgi:hypothetical protein
MVLTMTDEKRKPKIVHGTYACYTNSKCRCELCAGAAREYMRKYRQTEQGRQKSRFYTHLAAKRASRAASWLKENNPDVWAEICLEINPSTYKNGSK